MPLLGTLLMAEALPLAAAAASRASTDTPAGVEGDIRALSLRGPLASSGGRAAQTLWHQHQIGDPRHYAGILLCG